ncbi:MFS transporter [Paenibacillus sp. GD4]|jgi:MFS transporter, DHA3 family, macrolide efflux protein|uniref:MFS transporter n=1 Tax=Paenibacillus sp. GD4 TaxID=3068890 RepID=UPI00279672FA|nr:MFS transporter [Paenibacillus sp. GD4]MDQ1914936.1 MFS transporter [Paenibacillus sp. GD4]
MILKNRYVQSILLSHVLLQLGIWIRNFAILLYVTDLTNNDPYYVSLISVVEFAPIFVFSIIGGTFADRWRPKRTMVWCDLLSALSVFVVLVTLVYGSWYAVFFATFISAILSQFSQPSAMKLFKQHVAEDKLQGVMAMFQSMMAIFMVIGPMLGTFVYQRFGIEISIGVMGAMFLASALVLAFLPPDTVTEDNQTDRNFSRELRDGIRYVWNNPTLKTLAGMFAAAGLAVGLIQPLMIFVTTENLGKSKDFLQWLLMANGAAMLVGGGLVMAVAKKVSPEKLLAAGLISSVITTMVIGWSTSAPVTIAAQAIAGLFFPCIHIGINTLMLKNTEQSFIGRVNGVMNPMFMGFMVIGMSLSGVFKSNMSLFAVSCIAGLLFAAGAIMLGPLFKQGASHKSPAEKADPSTV